MKIEEVYKNLCIYDPRSPYYNQDVLVLSYDEGDIPPPRSENCYCDNCFYGRDALAIEILRLRGQLKKK